MVRYNMIASGRVQGVGFRYFVMSIALKYNITGWVQNLDNGNVQFEAQGDSRNIELFLTELYKGNFIIRVDNINMEKMPVKDKEKKFYIAN